jgi:hypothetical protein
VSRAGEEFFTISLSGEQPKEIADIVNAVAGAYMREVVEAEVVKRRDRLAELQKVLSGVEEDLRIKRQELRRLTELTSSASSKQSDQRQEHILEMQIEIRKQITQVDTELVHLKVRQRLKAEDESEDKSSDEKSAPEDEIPADVLENLLEQETDYATAKTRVTQLKSSVKRAEGLYLAGHPSLKKVQSDLAAAEAELAATADRLKPTIISRIEEQQRSSGEVT